MTPFAVVRGESRNLTHSTEGVHYGERVSSTLARCKHVSALSGQLRELLSSKIVKYEAPARAREHPHEGLCGDSL